MHVNMTNKECLLGLCAFAHINNELLTAIILSASDKTKTKLEWYQAIKNLNKNMSFEDEAILISILDFLYKLLENEDLKYYN